MNNFFDKFDDKLKNCSRENIITGSERESRNEKFCEFNTPVVHDILISNNSAVKLNTMYLFY